MLLYVRFTRGIGPKAATIRGGRRCFLNSRSVAEWLAASRRDYRLIGASFGDQVRDRSSVVMAFAQ